MRLAARGQRENDKGDLEAVDMDRAFDEAARRQAKRVTMLSLVTTAIVTAIAFIIPPLR